MDNNDNVDNGLHIMMTFIPTNVIQHSATAYKFAFELIASIQMCLKYYKRSIVEKPSKTQA